MEGRGINVLLAKLDEFIRKYYKNRMLKGAILSIGLLVLTFTLITVLEYFGRFSSVVRSLIFFSYILVGLAILGRYIVYPMLKLFRIGKTIDYAEAAAIIGNHFPDVDDKLLNTLQLQSQLSERSEHELLSASIEQRIKELKPVPFVNSIDLAENKRYFKYAIIPLALFLAVLFINSSIITDGTDRLVNYSKEYVPEAPFEFILKNQELSIDQYEEIDIELEVTGEELPDVVNIEYRGKLLRMKKLNANEFSYKLKNLRHNQDFRFLANKFYSKTYFIEVAPRANITDFEVELDYPAYTGQRDEVLSNTGDLVVPVGTNLKWLVKTENTDQLDIKIDGNTLSAEKLASGKFRSSFRAFTDQKYSMHVLNGKSGKADSISYRLNVIPDLYPEIKTREIADSTNSGIVYFNGEIGDDYGFNKLIFKYLVKKSDTADSHNSKVVSIDRRNLKQAFFYYFNFDQLGLMPGESVEYYFEVFDNDQVNGSKSSRSSVQKYGIPTRQEMEEIQGERSKQVVKDLESSLKDLKDIRKELDELKEKAIEKQELSWEDQQKLQNLMQEHQQIKENIERANELNKENNKERDRFNPSEERLFQKQQKLQEMFNKLLDEEFKETLKELEELMKDQNPNDLDDMKMENEELEKELDRMLEFYKELELERKLEESISELEELAKEQEKLAEKTANDENSELDELKEKQEELNKRFEDLDKKLEELEKENQELENPKELGDVNKESDDIKKDQEESTEELSEENEDSEEKSDQKKSNKEEKKKRKNASEKQKNAGEKMKEMASRLQESMDQDEAESLEEDMEALRMLLENLIKLSFEQEDLIEQLKENSHYSPVYVRIAQDQFNLVEDTKLIEDSLFALSKRIIELESTINKEMGLVNLNLEKAVEGLGNRQTNQAKVRQQYVMTSLNNLAVMLSEMFKQMQQQMAANMSGNQNCKKPGSGSGQGKDGDSNSSAMKKLSEMQKNLKKQLEEMKDGKSQKQGKKPGQGPAGGAGSPEFAKMVSQQAAIRQQLQKLAEKMEQEGSNQGGNLDKINELMDETERDLLNKNIDPETLKRQEEILSRLLKSEKAERERELDDKRKSETAREYERENPPDLEKYIKQKEKELELYRTVSPELNNYYRKKVEDYFLELNNK